MTLCRGPKKATLRVQPTAPLIAVRVAAGCPCSSSGASSGAILLEVTRSGDDDFTAIRYPIYDFNDNGDPRFFLDFQILQLAGRYTGTVIAGIDGVRADEVACGSIDITVGPTCGVTTSYVSMPTGAPGGGGRGADTEGDDFADMQPAVFLATLD